MGAWLQQKDEGMRKFGLRMPATCPSGPAVCSTEEPNKKRYYIPVHQHVFCTLKDLFPHLSKLSSNTVRFVCDASPAALTGPDETQSLSNDVGETHSVLSVTVVKHEWWFALRTPGGGNRQREKTDAKMKSIQCTPRDTRTELVRSVVTD